MTHITSSKSDTSRHIH